MTQPLEVIFIPSAKEGISLYQSIDPVFLKEKGRYAVRLAIDTYTTNFINDPSEKNMQALANIWSISDQLVFYLDGKGSRDPDNGINLAARWVPDAPLKAKRTRAPSTTKRAPRAKKQKVEETSSTMIVDQIIEGVEDLTS